MTHKLLNSKTPQMLLYVVRLPYVKRHLFSPSWGIIPLGMASSALFNLAG